MPLKSGEAGFSLVEATVAVAVLLCVCTATTMALLTSTREQSVLDARVRLDRVVESERARLAALPYWRAAAPDATDADAEKDPDSLLAAVFPHALAIFNTATAFFTGRDEGALFVTRSVVDGVQVEVKAMFVRQEGSGWTPLPADTVSGWMSWQMQDPPASTVEVLITGYKHGRVCRRRLRASALPAMVGRLSGAPEVKRAL